MNCEEFREAIFDDLEGALDAETAVDFRRHADACAACGEALRTIEEQEAALTALPRPKAPDTLWPGIRGALADRKLLKKIERPRWRGTGWLAAAATLLVAVGVFALVVRRPERGLPIKVVDISAKPGAGALGRMIPGYENPEPSESMFNALVEKNK